MNELGSEKTTIESNMMFFNLDKATDQISARAKCIVNKLIEERGHERPPFLPQEFARLVGIKDFKKIDLGQTSAVLLRFQDGYVVKVNEKHHPVRQNFSFAHEIGHILFDELGLGAYVKNIEYRTFNPQTSRRLRGKIVERLCDRAATELLMPELVFIKYLSGFGVSVHSIERLANIFKVSAQATAIRIAEVSVKPCIALLWLARSGTKPKALRLAWCAGPGIKSRGKAYYIPTHTNIRYPSVLHKAYEQDSHVKCHKLFKHGTEVKRLPMESKGFGYGENRTVISLAFLDRIK